jgi:regulator of sirC expression with transglutaminase-like and TPR domain
MTMLMNSSSEKAERSRIGIQIAVWNDSHTWLGPLREYARISTAIRTVLRGDKSSDVRTDVDSHTSDAAERRIKFLEWEIATLIEKHRPFIASASELLNVVFFRELRFALCDRSIMRRLDGDGALFDTVLASRLGPSTLMAILYSWIAEMVARAYGDACDFARVELVQATPTEVVRIISRKNTGAVWLVDLSLQGKRVSEEKWSSWCSAPNSNGFCRISWVQGLVRSLTELFKLLEKMPVMSLELLSAQLYVLDRIIALQPSETSRWAERAMLNTRRGDRSSALDDLKRFFAFHERETAPTAIVSLFDELRDSTSI